MTIPIITARSTGSWWRRPSRMSRPARTSRATPDHNPLLGEHPDRPGLFVAAGFSGHGLMMSPATGKVMSELIRTGRPETVDVTPLAIDRFARNAPFYDAAMI